MSDLKYSEVLNFILITLYDVKKIEPETYLKSSFSEASEIANYLETKGYVNTINIIGDILLQITSIGKLQVEELEEKYRQNYTEYFKKRHREGVELFLKTTTPEDPKNIVYKLIDKIQTKLGEAGHGENDSKIDLDIVRLEVSKIQPDFRIIDLKLNEFVSYNMIVQDIRELRNYIMHSD